MFLRLAQEPGIEEEKKDLWVCDLYNADEIFAIIQGSRQSYQRNFCINFNINTVITNMLPVIIVKIDHHSSRIPFTEKPNEFNISCSPDSFDSAVSGPAGTVPTLTGSDTT